MGGGGRGRRGWRKVEGEGGKRMYVDVDVIIIFLSLFILCQLLTFYSNNHEAGDLCLVSCK